MFLHITFEKLRKKGIFKKKKKRWLSENDVRINQAVEDGSHCYKGSND